MISGSQKFLDKIFTADKLRLFLDYDGTLADFAPTPDEVNPDPQLIDLMAQLRDDPRIDVAVISGRRLSHVQKLVPLGGVLLAGTYGVEILLPDGRQIDRVDFQVVRPILDEIKPAWLALIKQHPDFYLEDKGWSLALHARDVEDYTAEDVIRQARKFLAEIKDDLADFRILGGHKFLEIAPVLANKGSTIEYLVGRQTDQILPVYIGDDDKDEEAFEKILQYQGVAIKVGLPGCETRAQIRLNNPQEVRQFLVSLL
ncbi:MAG: trehalose-phosphatase [Anaerolineales bacterium]